MARNGAGTFSVVNPIIVGALRSSSAVNTNFTDMGDEITNSLPINGEAGMSGAFRATDGSALTPGIAFALDTNLGFRRSAVDEVQWCAGGADRATMDANGKLSLAAGLEVAGPVTHASGAFSPQTLSGTGAQRATLRRKENDTTERELASYEAGTGAGAKGSLRVVGGGANDVATMRFYVNDVLTFQWTGALFTHSVDTLFGASGIGGDADGFLDFPEVTAPASPAANVARVYARDDGAGTTKLYFKDGSGNERLFQTPLNRQVFTASGTWTKPTDGQTHALIENWGAGGGDGGGGGGYSQKVVALSSVSVSVSVVVGSGGTSGGGNGGNSSFGAYVTAYGGGGGDGAGAGGGGGGLSSAGQAATSSGGNGGTPSGGSGADVYGEGGNSSAGNCNPFGGGGGGDGGNGGAAFFGGGGGHRNSGSNGGGSIYGGGGGGGSSGGASIFGGNGGGLFSAGSAPGGGGGAIAVGARGEIRITCW